MALALGIFYLLIQIGLHYFKPKQCTISRSFFSRTGDNCGQLFCITSYFIVSVPSPGLCTQLCLSQLSSGLLQCVLHSVAPEELLGIVAGSKFGAVSNYKHSSW